MTFNKAGAMLKQLSDGHAMDAASTNTGAAKRLVLVQMRDKSGFWNNCAEAPSVNVGIGMAKEYQQTLGATVRVCVGSERKVVWESGAGAVGGVTE